MMIDIGTALFAFGIFAIALRNFELGIGAFAVATWCIL
jgi:hypothetical protein